MKNVLDVGDGLGGAKGENQNGNGFIPGANRYLKISPQNQIKMFKYFMLSTVEVLIAQKLKFGTFCIQIKQILMPFWIKNNKY